MSKPSPGIARNSARCTWGPAESDQASREFDHAIYLFAGYPWRSKDRRGWRTRAASTPRARAPRPTHDGNSDIVCAGTIG
jgi:hypothetical protein